MTRKKNPNADSCLPPGDRLPADTSKPPRHRLTTRQCHLFVNDMRKFGYPVTFEEIRKLADDVAEGQYNADDPIAMILTEQLDEAEKSRGRSG